MRREDELLIQVADRFMFHKEKAKSNNPFIREIAMLMCGIEIWEMWVLTQNR